MVRRIAIDLSESVWAELQRLRDQGGADLSTIVDTMLADAFDLERHALFQVSTSSALVKGVFSGVMTVAELRRHGDLGLGTFAGLDGEMVMIDGECYRATAGGVVARADDEREVPFALVTRFTPDREDDTEHVPDIRSLRLELDRRRPSRNIFVGIRVDGLFDALTMRAACPARDGEDLVAATSHQSEYTAEAVEGSLIGFWSPEYTRAMSVPGYHLHFISADRSLGGHVLEMSAGRLHVQMQFESEVHLALPETEEFLAADLDGDHRQALDVAETGLGRSDLEE